MMWYDTMMQKVSVMLAVPVSGAGSVLETEVARPTALTGASPRPITSASLG
jgi:hypothetical protein